MANTDGYAVMLSETTCASSGGFIEGAAVSNPEITNLHLGTGDHSGYYHYNGTDSTIAKWSGKVNTVMKDSKPMTSFKGHWEYVGGTGKYQGIKGKTSLSHREAIKNSGQACLKAQTPAYGFHTIFTRCMCVALF